MERQYLGKRLRYYRQLKNLKQDEVAVGICTISYLSRIENGIVIADDLLYEQLFERLGVTLEAESEFEDQQIAKLEEIYVQLLENRPIHSTQIELMQNLRKNREFYLLHSMAQLIYSRYLLSISENKEAWAILKNIEPSIQWQQDRITALYVAITALAHLSCSEYSSIITREEKYVCAKFLLNSSLFEQANYYYHLAFAYHRSYRFYQAEQTMKLAFQCSVTLFKPLFLLKLHAMQGVICISLARYKDAHAQFEAGMQLLQAVPDIQTAWQYSSLHNNIAYCYECQKELADAMQHYELANQYHEDIHSAINWMRVCMAICDKKQLAILTKRYPYESLSVLHHIHQYALISYIASEDYHLETLIPIEQAAFGHFLEEEHFELILYYAPPIAAIYEQLHAYKQASRCYKIAMQASEAVRKMMSSEGE